MRLSTIVGGIGEFVAGALLGGYGVWAHRPLGAAGGNAEQLVHGASSYVVFLFATLWGWCALYLFIEGLIRVASGIVGEPLGLAPVALVKWTARRLRARKPLPDVVMSARDGYVIESAHDYDWGPLTTVELDGKQYAVVREAGTPVRPHRYRLQPPPANHVIRTVSRYR